LCIFLIFAMTECLVNVPYTGNIVMIEIGRFVGSFLLVLTQKSRVGNKTNWINWDGNRLSFHRSRDKGVLQMENHTKKVSLRLMIYRFPP